MAAISDLQTRLTLILNDMSPKQLDKLAQLSGMPSEEEKISSNHQKQEILIKENIGEKVTAKGERLLAALHSMGFGPDKKVSYIGEAGTQFNSILAQITDPHAVWTIASKIAKKTANKLNKLRANTKEHGTKLYHALKDALPRAIDEHLAKA